MAAGKSEQRILRKVQHLSSKQREMEGQERHRAANQLPAAAGGVASELPAGDATDDNIIITSSDLQQQTPQAPPTAASAPPTTTPAATPVQTPVKQPQTDNQMVLQVSKPVLAPPGISHNASVRNRQKTIPNILSRSKNPAPPSTLCTKTVEGKTEVLQTLTNPLTN